MDLTAWIVILVVSVLVITIVFLTYRIVPVHNVDVVVDRKGTRVYSGDPAYSTNSRAAYFAIPPWVPFCGMRSQRLPLDMIEFYLDKTRTYERDRVRIETDLAAYAVIEDPIKVAARFPEGLRGLKEHIHKILTASLRETATKLTVREIINEREVVAQRLFETVRPEISKWGLKLHTVDLVGIRDPSDGSSTVIKDICSIAEVQIHAEARQKNAEQLKLARFKEAEAEEAARVREIERDKTVAIREQSKLYEIAQERQRTREEEMKVARIEQVRLAEIERDAQIQRAEGEKESIIRVKTGEAEGVRTVGFAEAEAKSKLADALKKINDSSLDVRRIEKDEKIGITAAEALKNAQIKFINAGTPTSILDLFSPAGGAHLGGMLAALESSDPDAYQKILKALGR